MLIEGETLKSFEAAKGLQTSILPTEELLKQVFTDSFVLYLPRDIVSGDFYWLEEVNDTVLK